MATVIDTLVTVITTKFQGNKDIQAAVNGYKKLDRQWQDTVRSLTRGSAILGAALTGAGATVVKATVPYEQALNDLRAFTSLAENEIRELDDLAKRVGSSGRFGATEVLEGQKEFLRNQFSVNETLAATPHIERLATAGLMEMDAAADLVAHTLRRFDLGADSVEHVTDVLAAMTRETGLNLEDLEATFRRAALVADRLGMSFEDTAASVGLLAREGLRPREAGSLLEAMLEDLTGLSDAANKELSRVGLDAGLVQGLASTGQIPRLFDELRKSGADIEKVFSTQGIDAAQILFDAGDQYAQLANRFVSEVAGTSRAMSDARNLGLPGAIEDFKSAINALQIALGSSGLTGIVEAVLRRLSAFIKWLSEASGWVKTIAVAAISAGPALLGLAAAVKMVSFTLGTLKLATIAAWIWNRNFVVSLRVAAINLRRFIANLSMARVAQVAGAIATGVATAATWAFNVALLANPIGLIIAAIVGLVAGLAVLVWKVDAIRNVFVTVWDWIKSNWPLLASILLGPFGPIFAVIWKFRDQIMGFLTGIFNWLKNTPIFGPLIDWAQQAIGWVKSLFGWVGKIGEAFGWVKGALGFGGGGGQDATPTPEGQAMLDFGNGLAAGPAMLPVAPVGVAASAGPVNGSVTVEIGEIVVNAPGADSREIAENVREQIRAEFRDLVISMDSAVAR